MVHENGSSLDTWQQIFEVISIFKSSTNSSVIQLLSQHCTSNFLSKCFSVKGGSDILIFVLVVNVRFVNMVISIALLFLIEIIVVFCWYLFISIRTIAVLCTCFSSGLSFRFCFALSSCFSSCVLSNIFLSWTSSFLCWFSGSQWGSRGIFRLNKSVMMVSFFWSILVELLLICVWYGLGASKQSTHDCQWNSLH